MKDAIGGTWLFGLVITFIFLFAGFLAYSINYTKAFRVKNEIIKQIEENEGYTQYTDSADINSLTDAQLNSSDSTEASILAFIRNSGYNFGAFDGIETNTQSICREGEGIFKSGGYCINKICPTDGPIFYRVTTYTVFEIPVINIAIRLPITGETKAMYYDKTKKNPIDTRTSTTCKGEN